MLHDIPALALALTLSAAPGADSLTYRQAVAAALRRNPELTAASIAVGTYQAEVWQAGLLPNPELRLEAENIGGSGDFAGVESAESTLKIAQLVELGGKRSARVAVAERERDIAAADVEVRQATVVAATAHAFIAVLAAQEQLRLAERLDALGTDAAAAVAAQARAGATSDAQMLRARLLGEEAGLLRQRRAQELETARAHLALSWGDTEALFGAAAGDLHQLAPPPALPTLLAHLEAAPELTRWRRELAARTSMVDAERAGAVPDLVLGAGPRYFSDTGDVALVAEVTMPLPLFDRRQGAIEAARTRLASGEAEQRAASLALRAAVIHAQAALAAGHAQAVALRDRLIPSAEAALSASRAAYRAGALRLDEFHDAQRTVFDLRGREIETLAIYHQTAAELQRLLGSPPGGDGAALPGTALTLPAEVQP